MTAGTWTFSPTSLEFPCLDFGDTRIAVESPADQHADAVGRDRGEGKFAPDKIVAANVASGDVGPD